MEIVTLLGGQPSRAPPAAPPQNMQGAEGNSFIETNRRTDNLPSSYDPEYPSNVLAAVEAEEEGPAYKSISPEHRISAGALAFSIGQTHISGSGDFEHNPSTRTMGNYWDNNVAGFPSKYPNPNMQATSQNHAIGEHRRPTSSVLGVADIRDLYIAQMARYSQQRAITRDDIDRRQYYSESQQFIYQSQQLAYGNPQTSHPAFRRNPSTHQAIAQPAINPSGPSSSGSSSQPPSLSSASPNPSYTSSLLTPPPPPAASLYVRPSYIDATEHDGEKALLIRGVVRQYVVDEEKAAADTLVLLSQEARNVEAEVAEQQRKDMEAKKAEAELAGQRKKDMDRKVETERLAEEERQKQEAKKRKSSRIAKAAKGKGKERLEEIQDGEKTETDVAIEGLEGKAQALQSQIDELKEKERREREEKQNEKAIQKEGEKHKAGEGQNHRKRKAAEMSEEQKAKNIALIQTAAQEHRLSKRARTRVPKKRT